ncbi:MAG: MATE family efflux transporter [Nanoarchaeota archaeon]|nr:MATE family efflux transporter [Nanoarchaeota archaeon]
MKAAKDFTRGSILKHILALALPTMASFMLHVAFNIIDTIFVGRIGADAIAAVSIVFPVIILMIALGSGMGVGSASLIARHLGAKNVKKANRVVEHMVLIAIVLSAVFALTGFLFAEYLFSLIGATPNVLELAMDYSRWIFGFGGFIFIFIAFGNVLRAEGDAKSPMIYMGISVILNAILDPLLIFGIWIFPQLGVEGAAIATVIGRGVGSILLISHVLSGKSIVTVSLDKFKYSFRIIKDIFAIGVPASLSFMLMSVGMFVLTRIIANFGPEAIASYGIGWKVESLGFHFAMAIAIACLALVGHNFGAGNVKRARKIVWISSFLSLSISTAAGTLIFFTQKFWLKIFTSNQLVLDYTFGYIQILAFTFGFVGLAIIIESAFQGFGKGMPKFILTIFRLGVLAIPLAIILSKVLGLVGVWYAIAISNVLNAIVAILWFKVSNYEK